MNATYTEAMAQEEALVAFRKLHGPAFLGVLLSILLVGTFFCQASNFFSSSRANRSQWPTQVLVLWLVGLEVFVVGIDVATLYGIFISRAGRAQFETHLPVTVKIQTIITLIPMLTAQLWLLLRVTRVSARNIPTTLIGLFLIAGSFTCCMVIQARLLQNGLYRDASDVTRYYLPVANFLQATTNLYLSFAFIWSMLGAQKQAISPRLGQLLRGLISVTLQSCLPPAICSLGLAIAVLTARDTGAYFFFKFPLPALYCISVLYTLYSRDQIVQSANNAQQLPQHVTPGQLAACGVSPSSEKGAAHSSSNHPHKQVRFEVDLSHCDAKLTCHVQSHKAQAGRRVA